MFLHGNHGICGVYPLGGGPRNDSDASHFDEYARSGVCIGGSVIVPNHISYGYLAERLASWGYIVVSINANRGINALGGPSTDPALIRARGNLVLKHLQRISEWNSPAVTFVKAKTFSTPRNNVSGWLGMKITVGPQDIVVHSLGRLFVSGNTGTHTVKIIRASDGVEVGNASVAMTGGTFGNFKYGALSSPVTLIKNTDYYIVSQEVNSGDYWYDSNSGVTTTTVATVNGSALSADGTSWTVGTTQGLTYGPLDFTYDVLTPASLGVDLKGKVDFGNVGLMGHSRGGEGVRAAHSFYRETGSQWPARILGSTPSFIRAIFEIAPTDNHSYKAIGTKWNVLLPMCDGDLDDLIGVRPFDRMLFNSPDNRGENPATQKSTYTVWGTNHNFYNTEWQVSDSTMCVDHPAIFTGPDGAAVQQLTSIDSVVPFFRANVGSSTVPSLNQRFDPLYPLPGSVTSVTRVDRGFTPTPKSYDTTIFEDFDKPYPQNSSGNTNDVSTDLLVAYGTIDRHDPSLRAAIMSWTTSGSSVYFQSNWSASGTGVNVYGNRTLDFRISRAHSPSLNTTSSTNFSIQLVMANGSVSKAVKLCSYTNLTGPVGGAGGYHPLLQTVRIPLGDFTGADVLKVRGVRFIFDETPSGLINIANIRFAR